jgi:hypothetical protein
MGSGALILYDFTREDHGMYTINNIFLCCSRVMEPELVKIVFFLSLVRLELNHALIILKFKTFLYVAFQC